MMDRSTQFAVVAAMQALEESGAQVRGEPAAVVTGCSLGGKSTEDEAYQGLYQEAIAVRSLIIPRTMTNAGASWISMRHGITGPCYTISTACASASHAIGQAFWMVRSGLTEVAVTGGNEAPFTLGMLRSWESMRWVSPEPCRPFSRDRRGLSLGEGAAMFARVRWMRRCRAGRICMRRFADWGCRSTRDTSPCHPPMGRLVQCGRRYSMPGLRRNRSATSTRTGRGRPQTTRPRLARSARCFRCRLRLAQPSRCTVMRSALRSAGSGGHGARARSRRAAANGGVPSAADPQRELDVIPNSARTLVSGGSALEFIRVWRIKRRAGFRAGSRSRSGLSFSPLSLPAPHFRQRVQ